MKQKTKLQKQLLSGLVGLALVFSASSMLAQDLVVTRFDDNSWLSGVWSWWGGAASTHTWDSTQNAGGGGAGSGSMYITVTYTDGDQYAIGASLAGGWAYNGATTVSCADYASLDMDVKWDSTNSTMPHDMFWGTAGDPDGLGMGITPGWGQTWFPDADQPTVPADGAWHHVSMPINPSWSDFPGIVWKKWFPSGGGYSGEAAWWVDNIVLIHRAQIIPPPTVSIEPVTCRGLQLYTSAAADRWQRQMIRTIKNDYGWIGNVPRTYTWAITNFSPGVPNWFNQFNTGIGSWVNWYGAGTLSWDSGTDGFTNSASGSLKVVAPFTGGAGEQFNYFQTFSDRWGWDWNGKTLNGNAYNSLQFDIKVDPSSAPTAAGDFTSLEVGFVTGTSPAETAIANYTIPGTATNGWVHVNLGIPVNKNYDVAYGIYLKDWVNGSLTNTLTFWIDNLVLYGANEQMHVFFVPEGTSYANLPYGWGDSSIDWNCKTMVFLRIEEEYLMSNATNFSAGDPSYTCRIGYKTNEPSSENMIFNGDPANGPVGLLTVLTDPEVLGEWSLTFNNSTDFTLTGPGGVSTNGSIPAGSASVFNDNMNVYFGHQPNSRANIYQTGQTLTLNHIAITGPDAIDDYFTMPPLDTNYWATCAAVSSVIRIVPWNTWWIIDWSVPAPGFTLQTSANLMTGWFDLPEQTASAVMPIDHMLAVITNGLPANDTGFFRMVKRTFAKLQILLPGMTGAPNTESGYTGTPADQVAFTPFSVIVHSVDSNWNVVNNSSDTIHLSSSDTGNFFVVNDPADLTLSSGTATFSVEELGDGSGTIIATDVTDGSKTAAESPTVNY